MNLTKFLPSLKVNGRVTYSLIQGELADRRAWNQCAVQSYSELPTDDELRKYIADWVGLLVKHDAVLIGVTIQYGDEKHYQLRVGTVDVHEHIETPSNKHQA